MNIQQDRTSFMLSQGFEKFLINHFQVDDSYEINDNLVLNNAGSRAITNLFSDSDKVNEICNWITETYNKLKGNEHADLMIGSNVCVLTGLTLNHTVEQSSSLEQNRDSIPIDLSIPTKTSVAAHRKLIIFRFTELLINIKRSKPKEELLLTGQYLGFNIDDLQALCHKNLETHIVIPSLPVFLNFCKKSKVLENTSFVPIEWETLLSFNEDNKAGKSNWLNKDVSIKAADVWMAYHMALSQAMKGHEYSVIDSTDKAQTDRFSNENGIDLYSDKDFPIASDLKDYLALAKEQIGSADDSPILSVMKSMITGLSRS